MTKHTLKTLALALISMNMFTACVVYDDGGYDYEYERPRQTTTTTTTTTEEVVVDDRRDRRDEVIVEEEVVVVEEEVIVEEEIFVPAFVPVMGGVSAELLESDPYYETSWQLYTFNFSDVADSYACTEEMDSISDGSVATIFLAGFEIDDEFAACPVGRYDVVPDCQLYEGEACVEILYRDDYGFEAYSDYATYGVVDVILEPSRHYGEPHRCVVSTSVDGDPGMTFDYELYFDAFDLSPADRAGDTICTM